MTYLEAVKEDRQQCMDGLKELVALPKLETRYTNLASIAINKEIKWLMACIHDMNKKIKLEEKKNDRN
ncbi:hypothetical protein P4I81_04510 [Bacillus cereus]|uniref:Gp27 n=4 Tax=root TaxID=1 RepID=B8R892_9CAUD|nr:MULTISPECIES: hypothetical protein [Bacillus cereus group]YP_002333588.1 gp27 [Bacillus phage TP21-L]ANT40042.1 hypothetical protein BMBtpLA3_7 [Bacillus phage BMBtpLA3]ACJ70553.1 gp27 [Bacillus phage TP21-L]EXY08872.1 hypothetical protein BF15_04670 [Bacillus thuringiensis]MCU4871087.1 hypothetical protein [Bacillus cereus]MDN4873165.1 hypothetical protein [Bacillus cereus]